MIHPRDMYEAFGRAGLTFFTGVPDSLLKHFCDYVMRITPTDRHIIAANEGGAVALAAGHFLATGNASVVYMQNSGLGNAINPLLSLADAEVYGIPMLLMIGWRGEPGISDEPQHIKQGRATLDLLEKMGLPYEIIGPNSDWHAPLIKLTELMFHDEKPVALVVRRDTFLRSASTDGNGNERLLNREDAIKLITSHLEPDDVVVSTTGMASRELFEIRRFRGDDHGQDFLTVGSMGHANQIALAIALRKRDRRVVCLDGDGSAIMHAGNMAIIGHASPPNLVHILLNNGAHDSVGGQPTAASTIDFGAAARAYGYRSVRSAESQTGLITALKYLGGRQGPVFLEVNVRKGARKDLGRPTLSLKDMRNKFRQRLSAVKPQASAGAGAGGGGGDEK